MADKDSSFIIFPRFSVKIALQFLWYFCVFRGLNKLLMSQDTKFNSFSDNCHLGELMIPAPGDIWNNWWNWILTLSQLSRQNVWSYKMATYIFLFQVLMTTFSFQHSMLFLFSTKTSPLFLCFNDTFPKWQWIEVWQMSHNNNH